MLGVYRGRRQGVYPSRVFGLLLNVRVRVEYEAGCRELALMSPVLALSAALVRAQTSLANTAHRDT